MRKKAKNISKKIKIVISIFIFIGLTVFIFYYNAFLTDCICLLEGCCSYEIKKKAFLSYFNGSNMRNTIFYSIISLIVALIYYFIHSGIEYIIKKNFKDN